MQIYNAQIPQFTLAATTTAFGTLISGSVNANMLLEIDFQGRGTSSADNEVGIYRIATAGITGSTAITATPTNAGYAAWAGTAFVSYATQPVKGALVHNFPLNSNGQRYFWRCNPNLNNAIAIPAGNVAAASIGFFPISGTGSVGGRVQLAQI
jgi:hypothetical protein